MKRKLFSLLVILSFTVAMQAQVMTEQFDYTAGSTLASNGWEIQSTGGSNPNSMTVGAASLTFPNYSPTAIGGSGVCAGNGEDINKYFGPIKSGSIYASFLLRVDTIGGSGYFFHFMDSASTSAYRARTFFQVDTNNSAAMNLGLTFNSSTGVFDTTEFAIGTTILVVAKYTIISGIDNDEVSLYAFNMNDNFATEPAMPLLGPVTGTSNDIEPARIALRQFNSGNDLVVDAFSVDTQWNMAPAFLPLSQIDLPINWDNATVDYTVSDFGGNSSMLAADPNNASNTVLKTEKTSAAQTWAGTTLGTSMGFANAIPFASGATTVSAVVYSPTSGTVIRLKVEDHTNNTITCETEATTSVANAWDTLVFDFGMPVAGTPALNFANTYDMMSIFYNFGNGGATPANTYYLDYLFFGGSTGGGTGGTGTSPYCATTIYHFNNPAEVASTAMLTIQKTSPNSMEVVIESGTTDPVDDLIIPGGSGAAISAIDTPAVGQLRRILSWATTPPDTVNMNVLWSKATFGGNWQLSTMNFDIPFDVVCTSTPMPKAQIDLPITWNDTATVDYTVTDFGGNASMLAADPTNASNIVLKSEKTSAAQTWAGTTLSTSMGFANAIPFASGATTVSALVYSPAIGTVIRLKVEDHTNNTITCETEATTTVANAWDTLVFDFGMPVAGTPALNFANTYDLMSIFYDFGNGGATPANTYYLDDVFFGGNGGSGSNKAQIDLPITWNDTANVDYSVTDFGGNASMLTADPMNASNLVLKSEKTSAAQTWAGTTLSTAAGLATAIPFAAGATTISAVVYSPLAGVPVRLKAEDAANSTISVETEALTSVANAWDTLVFDFANEASGTAPINFANTYNKLSIFYNFGAAGSTPANTYYLDDVFFGGTSTGGPINVTFQVDMNQYTGTFTTPEVNGTFNGWCGSCTPMSDANNDGIWEVTVSILADSIDYKFSFDNWTGQENLAPGLPCTKTKGGFTNRFLELVADTTLPAVCWESCTTCGGSTNTSNVTFRVDLSQYTGTYNEVNLNGTFNGWCGSCAVMTDANNDSIFEITVNVPNDTIEYKFTLDGWTVDEQFTPGDSCTLTNGGFTNRYYVPSGDTTLPAVCWESCDECEHIGLDEDWLVNVSVSPNPTNGMVDISGTLFTTSNILLSVYDIQGNLIYEKAQKGTELNERIDLSQFANGLYLIRLQTQNSTNTFKVVKTQ